jgi:hypothetical protein
MKKDTKIYLTFIGLSALAIGGVLIYRSYKKQQTTSEDPEKNEREITQYIAE